MFGVAAQYMALPFLNAAAVCRAAERATLSTPFLAEVWGQAARHHADGAKMFGQRSDAHLQLVAQDLGANLRLSVLR